MKVSKWLCTTCCEVFDGRLECIDQTKRHRRKKELSDRTTPSDFIREIKVDPDTTERTEIYDIAENEPGEHDPKPIVENEERETVPTRLWGYE